MKKVFVVTRYYSDYGDNINYAPICFSNEIDAKECCRIFSSDVGRGARVHSLIIHDSMNKVNIKNLEE